MRAASRDDHADDRFRARRDGGGAAAAPLLLADGHAGPSPGGDRRSGHGRCGRHPRDRGGDHRAAIFLALGLVSAGLGDRPLAAGFPASDPRRPRRAGGFGSRLRVQPGARRRLAARARVHHRALRGGPRHRAARDRRRARHPRPRPAESGDGRPRRSAQDRSRTPPSASLPTHGRSITSTPPCIPTRPARRKPCSSSPIASPSPSSR